MALCEALHVHLVDDRVAPARAGRTIVAPAERGVDDLAAPDARADLALDQLRVRIEQDASRIEAVRAVTRPVGAISVEESGPRLRQVAVPDEVGALAHFDALDLAAAARIEKAQLHALGVLREQREVDAGAVPGPAERIRPSAPDGARCNEGSCGRLHRRRAYVGMVFAGCTSRQPLVRQLPSFCRCIA